MTKTLYINFIISLWLTAITTFFLGTFVLVKNRRHIINKTFAFYSFSICWWSFCQIWLIACDKQLTALIWTRIEQVGVFFIPTLFVHFVASLLNIKLKKGTLAAVYLISIFFGLLCPTSLMMADAVPKNNIPYVKHFATPGLAYHFAILYFMMMVVFGLIKLYEAYTSSNGSRQNQLKYLFWSSLFGYIGGGANFILVYGISIPFLNPFGTYALPIYIIVVAYAIRRYRLMDINVALTRTAIFIFVYIPVLVIPFGLAGWAKPWLISRFGENWSLLPMLVLLALATAGPFAYLYLQRRAEKVLRRDQFHQHAIIVTAARNISLIRDIDKVLRLLAIILTKTLSITYAGVYLLDRTKKQFCLRVSRGGNKSEAAIDLGNSLVKYLQGVRKALVYEEIRREYEDRRDIFIKEIRDAMIKINADLLVPSFIEDELVGFLALGPKKLGEAYTVEDINVLTSLASQSALAIENAQFLKEREDMQGKLREAETLTTIRDLLGSFNHELYNLLTPISGTLQGINMGLYEKKPERLKVDLEKSIATTFFIKTYLGWVREYVESGDKIIAYQLSELINGGIAYSNDKIEKQNISKQVNVSPKIFVVGHECLPLLFKHLVIHSIYGYGMESGGIIDISARILEDRSTVEIIQTDTGDDLTKYIKEGSTMGGKKFAEKGKLGGTSYFIAQAVVSKHKGSFEVETTDGKGTKFRIRLPLDFNRATA